MKNVIKFLCDRLLLIVYVVTISLAISAILFRFDIKNTIAISSVASGNSMSPNYSESNAVVSIKTNDLNRGDVVIVSTLYDEQASSFEEITGMKESEIKRIIGLPGETVEYKINPKTNNFAYFINGILYEPYYKVQDEKYSNRKYFASITLGDNEYYIAGDNRNDCLDSRYLGPVKIENIISKVIYSVDTTGIQSVVENYWGK